MAFTNGRIPRVVGTVSGIPPRVESRLVVDPTTTAVGDFVTLTAGAWAEYAKTGAAIGGIYLGRDSGSISSGGVVIPTPGIDANGPGVFRGDGLPGLADTVLWGDVLVLTPDCLVEIDVIEGANETDTFVPGLVVAFSGATFVSASSGGFYVGLNGTIADGVDSACEVVELIRPSAAALHGRAVVRFNQSAVACSPGA